jgi:bifunctional UDP-N-acetylglucosamine pyrophosphorylase/glucosamine-1-phosphate N-acetyltransferase
MGVEYAIQQEQRGTGDAVQACKTLLREYSGNVLILSGDVPLLSAGTIQAAYRCHLDSQAVATVFTFIPPTPKGYGRIVRGDHGELIGIVEEKEATEEQKAIREVNAGIYFFDCRSMFKALEEVTNDNATGEFYLTDTISILQWWKAKLAAFLVTDPLEVEGVNNPDQLKMLENEWLKRQKS